MRKKRKKESRKRRRKRRMEAALLDVQMSGSKAMVDRASTYSTKRRTSKKRGAEDRGSTC